LIWKGKRSWTKNVKKSMLALVLRAVGSSLNHELYDESGKKKIKEKNKNAFFGN
jgi:hypothetical protein